MNTLKLSEYNISLDLLSSEVTLFIFCSSRRTSNRHLLDFPSLSVQLLCATLFPLSTFLLRSFLLHLFLSAVFFPMWLLLFHVCNVCALFSLFRFLPAHIRSLSYGVHFTCSNFWPHETHSNILRIYFRSNFERFFFVFACTFV